MKNTKKKGGFDEEYVGHLFDMLSILHDMKHSGVLPKELKKYSGIIESFSPDKLGIEEIINEKE
jgi:hypothetical protein